jgi:hypothetical protein
MVSDTTERADIIVREMAEAELLRKAALENAEIQSGDMFPDDSEPDKEDRMDIDGYLWTKGGGHL